MECSHLYKDILYCEVEKHAFINLLCNLLDKSHKIEE